MKLPKEAFLDTADIQTLQGLFASLGLGGSLMIQTTECGTSGLSQNILIAGNESSSMSMSAALGRARNMLLSSRFAHAAGHLVGIRDVSHESWVLNCHYGKNGMVWICYQPDLSSEASNALQDMSDMDRFRMSGIAVCSMLMMCLSENDPESGDSYAILESRIRKDYPEEFRVTMRRYNQKLTRMRPLAAVG